MDEIKLLTNPLQNRPRMRGRAQIRTEQPTTAREIFAYSIKSQLINKRSLINKWHKATQTSWEQCRGFSLVGII